MRIAPELIDPDADKVVRRLARHGFQAYLVGGCVRDLLLERTPKDFDVATSATPREIKQLFRNCRIIGRRFRLAHIFFGSKIIETSTFRANPREGATEDDGELLIRHDNVFGSDTEDAHRRDFRINGLFYDVEEEKVIDYVGGLADLESRAIATIGEPGIRFQEDPVRMMRAIKFAARLQFDIERESYNAIRTHKLEIRKCAQPRVLEELFRLLRGGAAARSMELLHETGIAAVLSPSLAHLIGRSLPLDGSPLPLDVARTKEDENDEWDAVWEDARPASAAPSEPEPDGATPAAQPGDSSGNKSDDREATVMNLLADVDRSVANHEPLSNSLLLAAFVVPSLLEELTSGTLRPLELNEHIVEILQPIATELRIARRDSERTRQILLAQRRLSPNRRRRGKPMALVRRDYFEDSLRLYEMCARATGADTSELDYWRRLRGQGVETDVGPPKKRRKRRRGGRRRRREELDGDVDLDVDVAVGDA